MNAIELTGRDNFTLEAGTTATTFPSGEKTAREYNCDNIVMHQGKGCVVEGVGVL